MKSKLKGEDKAKGEEKTECRLPSSSAEIRRAKPTAKTKRNWRERKSRKCGCRKGIGSGEVRKTKPR
ncbi:unnamed protein product, partial [Citrullus colocynthis]